MGPKLPGQVLGSLLVTRNSLPWENSRRCSPPTRFAIALGKADQDRASVGTNGLQARPGHGLCAQTTEVVFWISSASNQMPRRWNEWIRAHWRIENGSHYVRDTAFAEDASRIRKNPDIAARLRSFAYNLIRAAGRSNIRNARWRAALDLNLILQLPRLH